MLACHHVSMCVRMYASVACVPGGVWLHGLFVLVYFEGIIDMFYCFWKHLCDCLAPAFVRNARQEYRKRSHTINTHPHGGHWAHIFRLYLILKNCISNLF